MMNKILLGRYIPGNSPIHRLDPRTKLILSLLYVFIIFLATNWLGYLILTLGVLGIVLLSGIDLRFFLRGVRPMIWLILFTVVFQILFTPGETVYWSWGPFSLSLEGIINGVYIFLRLVLIIMTSTILTLTTSPLALTDGIEHLFRPLARFGFPAHEMALMMSIALRYVPTLLDEAQKIMDAQRARGVDFDEGNLIQRIKSVIPILVPLFVSAFNRAEEMANAMEARGYRGGEGRTKYRQLQYHTIDGMAWVVTALLAGAVYSTRWIL